jgi:hypothetical protein
MTKGIPYPEPARAAPAGGARWIVYERTGLWARGLRGEPAAAGLRIHEVRSLADCWEMLDRFPSSFVVVEVSRSEIGAVLARLTRWEREYPFARTAVVAERSLAGWEWVLREAGAVWFTASRRELLALAAIARRHLKQVPEPEMGIVERIWSRLPWGVDS